MAIGLVYQRDLSVRLSISSPFHPSLHLSLSLSLEKDTLGVIFAFSWFCLRVIPQTQWDILSDADCTFSLEWNIAGERRKEGNRKWNTDQIKPNTLLSGYDRWPRYDPIKPSVQPWRYFTDQVIHGLGETKILPLSTLPEWNTILAIFKSTPGHYLD